MRKLICFCLILFISGTVFAEIPNREKYDKYFEIDLNDKLPTYDELQKRFVEKNTVYDRRYKWHWDIGHVFDAVFRTTIGAYGATDRRVKAENEDALISALELLPPEYYQYIGPYLHTIPTISEKVLNMPGIKETKNKFPTRIAPQLADIKDIEFLSPYLYFLLMPEAWPDNLPQEQPLPKKQPVKAARNTQLYDLLRNIVPADEFYPDAQVKQTVDMSDLRTINLDINSPLTSGDIKAFARTLPALNEIKSNVEAMARIYGAGTLLDMWENEQGKGLPINSFKDLIYPCSRLLQKMRLAGEERYLKSIVAKEGFSPEQWAYTCDKTIKAYNMTTLSHSTVQSLKAYALGIYENDIRDSLSGQMAEMQLLSIQAALRMHEVPRHDILEAYKNRKLLRESFQQAKYAIIAAPIVVSN